MLEEGTPVVDGSVITTDAVEVGFIGVNNSVEVESVCSSELGTMVTSVVASRAVEEP